MLLLWMALGIRLAESSEIENSNPEGASPSYQTKVIERDGTDSAATKGTEEPDVPKLGPCKDPEVEIPPLFLPPALEIPHGIQEKFGNFPKEGVENPSSEKRPKFSILNHMKSKLPQH